MHLLTTIEEAPSAALQNPLSGKMSIFCSLQQQSQDVFSAISDDWGFGTQTEMAAENTNLQSGRFRSLSVESCIGVTPPGYNCGNSIDFYGKCLSCIKGLINKHKAAKMREEARRYSRIHRHSKLQTVRSFLS